MHASNSNQSVAASSLSILVVEDDLDFGETLVDALSVIGHKVTLVESAEDVVDASKQGMFDIYILDINLPDESGLSLSSRLREASPNVGIIMLTARSSDEDITNGYNFGGDIYLTKPVSMSTLESAINSLSRRLISEINTSLILNTRTYALGHVITGQSVSLTASESFVLSAFLTSPKNKLEFWQIGELLNLDMDADFKHAIELHISRLRKKISSTFGDQISIKSIRGWGYQFSGDVKI